MRMYNPPVVLLSKGTKEGVDIGGALSILAMDSNHNLHIAQNLISELSWGQFWKEEEIADQIETITVKHEDNVALFDPDELVKRIVKALAKIRANKWILFGIANFESNSFQDEMLIEGLDYSYVESLMEEHKRVRDAEKFPKIYDERIKSFISTQFDGKNSEYFHYKQDIDLFTIFGVLKQLTGSAAGIVCTSQGAANFHILSENIAKTAKLQNYRIDTTTLEKVISLIRQNVIFPISWFKIDLGLAALKTLDLWSEIKDSILLRKALLGYFQYFKTTLKEEHDKLEQKKSNTTNEDIDVSKMDEMDKSLDMKSIEEILNMQDLGLFRDKEDR